MDIECQTPAHLRVGGSISPGARAWLRLRAPTVSAILAEARPVTETMSPAPATSRSMRPVPDLFQIFVSLPSSPVPPTQCHRGSMLMLWTCLSPYSAYHLRWHACLLFITWWPKMWIGRPGAIIASPHKFTAGRHMMWQFMQGQLQRLVISLQPSLVCRQQNQKKQIAKHIVSCQQ